MKITQNFEGVSKFLKTVFVCPHLGLQPPLGRFSSSDKKCFFVAVCYYTFFKDCEHLPYIYGSIGPGRKTGDPTVCDICALLFKKNAVMYKLRHTEEWKPLPQQRNQEVQADLKALYTMPLTIDRNKYNSLQSLKQFMHTDYHHFYDNLYH